MLVLPVEPGEVLLISQSRASVADRVRAISGSLPELVTDAFLARHPDWLERFGDRARARGVEDARYHLVFLAAALEHNTPGAFADYARWTARVLAARGIAPEFLAENLLQLRDELRARLPLDAHAAVEAHFNGAVEAIARGADDGPAGAGDGRLALTRSLYLQAVLAGERASALTVVLEALREGISILDLYVEVLQGTLYEVGRLWETNRITVAHEHAATAITQFVMAHVYDRIERTGAAGRGTLLMTGLEGELHSVGALMVADVLESQGWTVHFLGTNLPHPAILQAVRERQPDWVGVSATMLYSLPAVRRLVDGIRAERGSSTRIVVGGGAFRHAPEAWRQLGADGHARDLHEAMTLISP